jgi:hypothetical protein
LALHIPPPPFLRDRRSVNEYRRGLAVEISTRSAFKICRRQFNMQEEYQREWYALQRDVLKQRQTLHPVVDKNCGVSEITDVLHLGKWFRAG